MPFIDVKTNAEIVSSVKDELKTELGQAITAIRGKSEAWLMIQINEPSSMYFKGDASDCAMFSVSIFGSASKDEYNALTAKICNIAEKHLNIPASRVYVKYTETAHWGWNNMNF